MADPIDEPCPICDAAPGERCWSARGQHRATFHADRGRSARRELRAYDLEPAPVPHLFQADPSPAPEREEHGLVRHSLDETTRAVGLNGIVEARAQLAGARYRRTFAEAIEHGCSHADAEVRARQAAGWS